MTYACGYDTIIHVKTTAPPRAHRKKEVKNMQPTVLKPIEHFNNLMAMKVFVEACDQWNIENKDYNYQVFIKEMYFDAGQDWKYTGFLTVDTSRADDLLGSWQSLCPRDWELVVTETDISKIVSMAWFYMDNLQKPYAERKNLYEKF